MPSAILCFFVRKIVGHPDSPTVICAVDGAHPVISGGVAVTGWKRGCNHPAIPEKLKQKIWSAEAPLIGNRRVETRQMWVNGHKVQRAAQFPDGGLERMIDFNPEEQNNNDPRFSKCKSEKTSKCRSTGNDCPSTLGNCYFAREKYRRERRTSCSSLP